MPTRPKIDKVAEAINGLADAIKKLESKLGVLEAKVLEKIEKPGTTQVYNPPTASTQAPETLEKTEPRMPFPKEWRDVIDTVLNVKFDATVKYLDNANFELTIYVPREYSNATKTEWDMNKCDRRIKIMPNHLGAAGVRDYATLVAENLGHEMRTKIGEDRAKII